jgi:signal transduction histidine kinase
MKSLPRQAQVFLVLVCLIGTLCAVATPFFPRPPTHAPIEALALFFALSILAGGKKVQLIRFKRAEGEASMSMGFAIVVVTLLEYGPLASIPAATLSCLSACLYPKQQQLHQLLFNVSLTIIEAFAAGLIFLTLNGGSLTLSLAVSFYSIATMCLVSYAINTFGVATIIALCTGQRPYGVWKETFLWTAPSYFAGGSISALAIALMGNNVGAVLMFGTPIVYLTYQSYAIFSARAEEKQRYIRELQEKSALVHLMQRTATAANEARSFEEAAETCLDHVCAHYHWPLAHVYLVERGSESVLLPTPIWYVESPFRYKAFLVRTACLPLGSGEDLPGSVLTHKRPMGIKQIADDPHFLRGAEAKEAGIASALAFPVLVENRIVAILEYFTTEPTEADDVMIEIMSHVGFQLGRVLERRWAETNLEAKARELACSNQALEEQARELARSNADLEQFAYIASHDLQEPLRSVSSYAQLLARRYKGKLDADADDFITYTVEGTVRMQELIKDMLEYSRVGTRGKDLEPTDGNDMLAKVLKNLAMAIEDNQSSVTYDLLPTLRGDGVQLSQLFQNLIGNALKFHGDRRPEIHVGAERRGDEWEFSVRDNGIGIEPQYAERIFVIFQRLHTRSHYSGNGMGLAICKKIVERHGGRIWMQSRFGEGTTFFFTLPA